MGRRHSVPGPAERASEAVALEGSRFLGGSMSVPAPKQGFGLPVSEEVTQSPSAHLCRFWICVSSVPQTAPVGPGKAQVPLWWLKAGEMNHSCRDLLSLRKAEFPRLQGLGGGITALDTLCILFN